jgi:hypothetical protein
METTIPLKDIDFLLRRNWFFDRESVIDVLYLADEYSWEWIVNNRSRYSKKIQEIISIEACLEAPIWKSIAKTKVRDFEVGEYEKMIADDKEERKAIIEKQWILYKNLHNISRPPSNNDLKCEEVYNKIQEQLKLTKNKRTIPADVQNKINTLQNEFEKLKTRIEQEDKDWEYLTKTDLILDGTLSKMQKEVNSCSNV